jgi:hypothetical protein
MTAIVFLSLAYSTLPRPSQAPPNVPFTGAPSKLPQSATSATPMTAMAAVTAFSKMTAMTAMTATLRTAHDAGRASDADDGCDGDLTNERGRLVRAKQPPPSTGTPRTCLAVASPPTNDGYDGDLMNDRGRADDADDGYDGDLMNDRGRADDANDGHDGDLINDRGRLVRAKQPPPSAGAPRTYLAVASPLPMTAVAVI